MPQLEWIIEMVAYDVSMNVVFFGGAEFDPPPLGTTERTRYAKVKTLDSAQRPEMHRWIELAGRMPEPLTREVVGRHQGHLLPHCLCGATCRTSVLQLHHDHSREQYLQGEPHMNKHVLFIHGAGEGAFEEDGLLVASLHNALGPAYDVRYPKMPEEDSATYADWKAPIERALATLDNQIILVGHSVGASVLIKYLSEEQLDKPIIALFLLATPYWSADEFWTWDEARLSEDVAAKLASIPHISLYHSRDDEVVPFAHLVLYTAKLPQATIREFDGRGHQFGNDLTEVAEDIRRCNDKRREL